ncbi:hypothetical protein [Rhizobium sp. LjRoot254]|uniref:hypothetical protein n=1 Tax=Rhizobium sp. LjRoot254 TaxID=3342297 RepID=UPI003ED0218C
MPWLRILLALACVAGAASAVHAEGEPDAWSQAKCARYDKAFHELLDLGDRKGETEGFIKGNEDFIKAGCSNGADVCPQSAGDFKLANDLTLAAMGFGTASTFLPFICRSAK